MSIPRRHTLCFGPYSIRPENDVLYLGDSVVALEPSAVRVLRYLAEHCDRVVSRSELLDGVWTDVFTGDGVLKKAIWQIRRALADDPAEPRFVRTFHARGYRFIAHVEARCPDETAGAEGDGLAALRERLGVDLPDELFRSAEVRDADASRARNDAYGTVVALSQCFVELSRLRPLILEALHRETALALATIEGRDAAHRAAESVSSEAVVDSATRALQLIDSIVAQIPSSSEAPRSSGLTIASMPA